MSGMTGPAPRYGVVGVEAALQHNGGETAPTLFTKEFALTDRVGVVTGGNRGLGLEMACALVEAGARVVYCIDLPTEPSEDFHRARAYVKGLKTGSDARLDYISADTTNQQLMWKVAEKIGDQEGRLDFCVAAAGVNKPEYDCLDYPDNVWSEVMRVNCDGVFFTAQAVGRQMRRFGNGGSITLIASMSGTIQNQNHGWCAYNTSKSAVLQMGRTMACQLGKDRIRVNTISPGYIYTSMTRMFLDGSPGLYDIWASQNPQSRIGRPDELRGVATWLASDASSYCTGSDIIVDGGHRAW
ncbi:sorbose reductase [Phanerochaete sordida]|uniref:Sorbose reductase n=1 Tax=Phanerochaete sordida TaxID=48140 RepID=A0A9P3GLX3_9APHY|nr:sorbose reductase [Phanerochaete sordida]